MKWRMKNSSFHFVRPTTLPTILPASCDAFKPSLYPTILASFLFYFTFSCFFSFLLQGNDNFVRFFFFKFQHNIQKQPQETPHGKRDRDILHRETKWPITQRNEKRTLHRLMSYTLVHNASENRKGRGFRGKCVGWSSGLCVEGAGFPLHAPQQ